jgi:hypothetical protein
LAKFLEPQLEHQYETYEKYKNYFNTKNFLLVDQPCISNKFPTAGYVRDILNSFADEYNLDLIPLPKFGCDEQNEETAVLKQKYRLTQERAHQTYLSPDFLFLVLQKFGRF